MAQKDGVDMVRCQDSEENESSQSVVFIFP